MDSVNNNYPCLPNSSTSCVPDAYSETPTQLFPIVDGGVYVDDYEPVHYEDDDIGDSGVSLGDYEPVCHEDDDKWIIEPDDDGLGFSDSSSEEDNSKSMFVSKTICSKTSKGLPLMKQESGKTSREQVKTVPGDMYVINVDGYYRKGRKGSKAKGGYGVIIRRVDGESIIAKTGCAQVGVSEFFHTVQGIMKGLELVSRYPGITRIYITCNSEFVNMNVNHCFASNYLGSCTVHPMGSPFYHFDVFCANCLRYNVSSDEFDTICEYMKVIVTLGKSYSHGGIATYSDRDMNIPADYLAKMQLSGGEEKEFEPHEFPSELKELIEEAGFLLTYPL